ncbi:MAG: hypothetical protein ACI87E_001399, partial [Mariniblastus sp.]
WDRKRSILGIGFRGLKSGMPDASPGAPLGRAATSEYKNNFLDFASSSSIITALLN